MRRQDREVTDRNELIKIMEDCDVCRLGLNDKDGYPYILPLNFGLSVAEDKVRIFFHGATEGYKFELIENDNRATFEMDCKHLLEYIEKRGYCTFYFESVVGKGKIKILSDEEKMAALENVMFQYHKVKNKYFNPAALERTCVYCLEVESMTGKRKMPK